MSPTMRTEIKQLIIDQLYLEGMTPDMIDDEQPLFGEGLGLDSVDALELVVVLEKAFGIKIEGGDATRQAFASVATLSDLVDRLRAPGAGPSPA
jgi:acyl carrier protein